MKSPRFLLRGFRRPREVALTAKIFRVPANGSNLFLTNNLAALKNAGYVFAEGTRNAFDFAFAPNGDLYVSDGYGNARVHQFSPDGELRRSWGEPGIGPGQFMIPHGGL